MTISVGFSCVIVVLFFGFYMLNDADKQEEQDKVELDWNKVNLFLEMENPETGLSYGDEIINKMAFPVLFIVGFIVMLITVAIYVRIRADRLDRVEDEVYESKDAI